jgi:hypothetical protein
VAGEVESQAGEVLGLDDHLLPPVRGERQKQRPSRLQFGCGNGGLSWREAESMIRQALGATPGVEVRGWEPADAPNATSMTNAAEAPLHEPRA